MKTPYSLDLHTLSRAYAAGSLNPERVVDDVCAAIEARGDDHVWIHRLSRAEALAQVESARRRNDEVALPLYGIPFAVKDNIDLAGHPTTAACPAFRYIADATAPVVQRLLDAGAILIGKTNLDQFATGLTGTRSPYGACANVFDARYISGGSSSGSAVAVAAGLVSFALGTDTAGSGRVPAAFNNIVGLKPTRGLLSARGVVPACRSLDCVSIFALTCDDARRVFDCARGRDPADAYSRRHVPASSHAPGGRFRFGVPRSHQLEFFGDADAERVFHRAVQSLEALGGTSVAIDFEPFTETASLLYQGPWVAERLAAIKDFFPAHSGEMDPVVRQIVGGAEKFSAVDAFEAAYRLEALRQRCSAAWGQIDVLAVPSTGTIYTRDAIASEPVTRNTRLGYYTNFVNLLDLAAIAVPAGFRADGLPAGITLIAPALGDHALLTLGEQFHRMSGVPLGATGVAMPEADAPATKGTFTDEVSIAVVGAHLSGLPLNHELTARGARLVASTTTAPLYRLYALAGTRPAKPGLVRVAENGAAIEVEVWSMPAAAFGSFVAGVPSPLAIGTVTLNDGRPVKGFVCEVWAVAGAQDISSCGGWRNYLAHPGAS